MKIFGSVLFTTLLPLLAGLTLTSCGSNEDTMLNATIVTRGGSVNIIKSHSIPINSPGDDPTETTFIFGEFGQQGLPEDAGNLTINGDSVAKSVDFNGFITYNSSLTGQEFPDIKFDGSTHTVAISGNDKIPQASLIVTSPKDFMVTAPASGPVFNRASDLAVEWTGGSSSSSDSISISLSPDGTNANAYTVAPLPDNGNYSIPAAQLEQFGDTVVIIVSKYRRATTTTGGRVFTATSEVRWAYPVLLQ